MPRIAITKFHGMTNDESIIGGARYSMGVDVWGMGDNTAKISKEGIIQSMKLMNAGSEAASTNDVTDLITHFAYYPTSGTVWGMSSETSPRLYERVSPWTLRRSTSGSDLATATNSGNIIAFAGRLWVAQNTRISSWDNSTWTAAFAGLNSATEHVMRIFAGKLYIADGRYVDTIDSTPTFTDKKLTLPAGYTIRSMEVFGDRIYMFADDGRMSRLFIWDGEATTFQSSFDIAHSIAPYLVFSNGILWCVPPINNSPSTPIYVFNGSSFEKVLQIPGLSVQQNRDAVVQYGSGILIASENSTNFEDGTSGLWMIRKTSSGYEYGIAYNPAGGVTTTDIGGIISPTTNQIYVGTNNASTFQVFELLGNADTQTIATSIWQSHPIDGGDPAKRKQWNFIQVSSDAAKVTNSSIVVKYRLDNATSWTTLQTITSTDTNPSRPIAIRKTGKVIEIRLELVTGTTTSAAVRGMTLDCDVLNR